jgi:zinc-ribbon domain
MVCVNCGTDLPEKARYCLECGASQPVATDSTKTAAADGEEEQYPPENMLDLPSLYTRSGYDWLEREARLDSAIDYNAQRRYEGATGKMIGCIGYAFIGFIGLIALVPGIPLLAILGIPTAAILAILTYINAWNIRERLGQLAFLQKLPGFKNSNAALLSFSIFTYLTAASVLSILLLAVTTRR